MTIPGFTAETSLEPSTAHYATGAASAPPAGGVTAALVAPTICRTSPCFTVGNCRTRVRCCRTFTGACSCKTFPCFIFPPIDLGAST